MYEFVGEWSLREWSEQSTFVLPSGGGKAVAVVGNWDGGGSSAAEDAKPEPEHEPEPEPELELEQSPAKGSWPKVFVVSSQCSDKMELSKKLLRSYDNVGLGEVAANCHVWEAGRATGAAPSYLDSIEIDRRVYIDGGLLANNPTMEALEEAHMLFPGRKIGCVVSLGCSAKRDDGDDRRWLYEWQDWMTTYSSLAQNAQIGLNVELPHEDVLQKVWGCRKEASSTGAELFRATTRQYTEAHKFGSDTPNESALHAEWLGQGALYARINPELSKVPALDSKDPAELAAFESATREFVEQDAVQAVLQKVKRKLVGPPTYSSPSRAGAEPEYEGTHADAHTHEQLDSELMNRTDTGSTVSSTSSF